MLNSQFIALARSFISGEQPESCGEWATAELWHCAAQQNMLPVLAYENKKWKIFCRDAALAKRLDSVFYAAVVGSVNRIADFEELSATLSANGIEHMPVKGYYLRRLWPAPEMRTFGDIDILIHPHDRQRTHELMKSLGYAVEHDWEPTFSYIKGAEYYEIHTNLMDGNLDGRADLQKYFCNAWQHAVPDEGLRFAPDKNFHFIYTVCHLAKHLYGGGAGLRMYIDIALQIQKYDVELDWAGIAEELEILKLTEFFHTVMNACRDWLGVETSCSLPEADEEALSTLLEYTLDSDLFGHIRDHSVVELRNADEKNSATGKLLLRMLFPSADEIEQRYTFLKGRRWLLPAAWILRFFMNIKLVPKRLCSLKQLAKADAESVNSYDIFMNRIGL